jgi:hypothetical protein
MNYIEYNPNPYNRRVDDCAVRAVAKAIGSDWHTAYAMICDKGAELGDMPHSDSVWGTILREYGFIRHIIPNTCPNCYTAADFCADHPKGTFVLAFGGHVATVVNGNLYDSWDSSTLVPMYFWERRSYR